MTLQLRKVRFTTDDLDIRDLRIRFAVTKSLVGYPNLGKFEIYNMSESSRNKLIAGENGIGQSVYADGKGSGIEFYAGNGVAKLLFVGKVVNVIHRYVKPDWISEVYAGDAIDVLNTATINKTVSAGSTTEQIFDSLVNEMQGVTKGITEGLTNCLNNNGDQSLLRSLQLSGDVKTWLREMADNCGFEWSINEGVIETVTKGQPLTDVIPYIINQDSGMIGSPERTDVGVEVRVLLTPELRLARRIRIESVNDLVNVGNLFFRKIPPIRNGGIYRIDNLIHSGDTHSDVWETAISGRIYG